MSESDIAGSQQCAVEVDGYWEFFNVDTLTARKPHKCGECGDAIEPGEEYEYAGGKWEGHLSYHKTCKTCVRIRDDLCKHGFYYGAVREQIWACYGVDYVSGRVIEDDEEPSFDFAF